MRYFKRWPVLDQGLRLSVLHEEALDELADELDSKGLVIFGDVEWALETVDIANQVVTELHAAVPVRRFRITA